MSCYFIACSPPVFNRVRVTRSLVLCVMFCISLLVLLSYFHLAIALSVLLFTESDFFFGIFKLFLYLYCVEDPIIKRGILKFH
jgi:hypothetical protein